MEAYGQIFKIIPGVLQPAVNKFVNSRSVLL